MRCLFCKEQGVLAGQLVIWCMSVIHPLCWFVTLLTGSLSLKLNQSSFSSAMLCYGTKLTPGKSHWLCPVTKVAVELELTLLFHFFPQFFSFSRQNNTVCTVPCLLKPNKVVIDEMSTSLIHSQKPWSCQPSLWRGGNNTSSDNLSLMKYLLVEGSR